MTDIRTNAAGTQSLYIGDVKVTIRKDALRPIRARMIERLNEGALLLQRTVRDVVGVRAPHIKVGGRTIWLGPIPPGRPPFARKRKLYGRVVTHKGRAKSGLAGEGRAHVNFGDAAVAVTSYGYEASGERPHLRPVVNANRSLIASVVAGRGGAPRVGNTAGLKPEKVSIRARPDGLKDAFDRARELGLAKRARSRHSAQWSDPAFRRWWAARAAAARWKKAPPPRPAGR